MTNGWSAMLRRNAVTDAEIEAGLTGLEISFRHIGGQQHVFIGEEDVSDLIRTPEVTMNASRVSALPAVRAFLLDLQRKIAAEQSRAEVTIAAETRLTVAATELKAAEAEAAAKLAKAEADRKVVEARTTAEAEVMKREVAVYDDERDYLRARLYEKTAPRVTDVVTADDPREMMGIPAKSAFANEKGGAK